jgi:UDP-N-acetylmuramoyl-tripeptide--D-alanyl-D-alanine ligase
VLAEKRRHSALPPGVPAMIVENSRAALGRIAAAYRGQYNLEAIAIAGSNGKTTTKELVASVLRERLDTVWSAASFNNDVGVPLTLLSIESRHRAGVFEAGTNHPGELLPLLGMIQPRGGVITSIGREHLEHFGGLEGVLQEEGALAEALPPDGFLVIGADGFGADELARRSTARVIRVGTGRENDWRIGSVEMNSSGTRFALEAADSEFNGWYETKLLGSHQVVNATYAIVVGKELGLGRADIQRGLASCTGAKMRLQLKQIDGFTVLDDAYNANADSMEAALETLRQFPCTGRRIAVLGEMAELGSTRIPAHEEIGRRAAGGKIDFLVTVGKSSPVMAAAARNAGLRQVVQLDEVESAGPAITEIVAPGDVVLVKASRAARLERVVEFLAARFGSPESPETVPRSNQRPH